MSARSIPSIRRDLRRHEGVLRRLDWQGRDAPGLRARRDALLAELLHATAERDMFRHRRALQAG
jgi:hypothetical protein